MRRIIIKIPREGEKWLIGFWGRPRKMLRADTLLNRLERRLLPLQDEKKMTLIVKEYIRSHWESTNQSLASSNKAYLIYCAACFLEDYLSLNIMRKLERRYANYER